MSDECPFCRSDLRGEPIPVDALKKGYYGKWDGVEERFYSRKIGIEIPEKYDGVSVWLCPDCGARWDRWTGKKLTDE